MLSNDFFLFYSSIKLKLFSYFHKGFTKYLDTAGVLCVSVYHKLESSEQRWQQTPMEVVMRGLLNPADIRTTEEVALAKAERDAEIFQKNVEFLVQISRRGSFPAANVKKHPGLKTVREHFEEFQVR